MEEEGTSHTRSPKEVFREYVSRYGGNEAAVIAVALNQTFVYCDENGVDVSIGECAEMIKETKVDARKILALPLAYLAGYHKKMREVVKAVNACCESVIKPAP